MGERPTPKVQHPTSNLEPWIPRSLDPWIPSLYASRVERKPELFLERAVPKEAREAYRRESIGALFGGVYIGAIFPFIGFIARDSLHASAALIGLMVAAPFMGNVFALFYANAVEGKPKMPYVVWSQVVARALFLLILFAKTPLVFAVIVTAVQVIASAAGPAYAAILKEI